MCTLMDFLESPELSWRLLLLRRCAPSALKTEASLTGSCCSACTDMKGAFLQEKRDMAEGVHSLCSRRHLRAAEVI